MTARERPIAGGHKYYYSDGRVETVTNKRAKAMNITPEAPTVSIKATVETEEEYRARTAIPSLVELRKRGDLAAPARVCMQPRCFEVYEHSRATCPSCGAPADD